MHKTALANAGLPLMAAPSSLEVLLVDWSKMQAKLPRLAEAADYARSSDRAINEDRQSGRYYALVTEGKTGGFPYPKWPFDADVARIASVRRLLNDAGLSCWGIN